MIYPSILAPSLLGLFYLSSTAYAKQIIAYNNPGCNEGDDFNTIDFQSLGQCWSLNGDAGSVRVVGDDNQQWSFHNNFPCNTGNRVGTWIGNVCFNQGETSLRSVTDVVQNFPYVRKARDVSSQLEKRQEARIVESWLGEGCDGAPTNRIFWTPNAPIPLNDVGAVRIQGLSGSDRAYACTDSRCEVANRFAELGNGVCVIIDGSVNSVLVFGVPDDTPYKRSVPRAAPTIGKRQDSEITCESSSATIEDAQRVGDDWEAGNSLACCCDFPGGPNSRTVGTARGVQISVGQCSGDPSGPPPIGGCGTTCGFMRSTIYNIAATCQQDDGTTGGTYTNRDGSVTIRLEGS